VQKLLRIGIQIMGKFTPARNRRSSLLGALVNYGHKKLYNIGPWRWCRPCSRQTCRKSL